jgi:transposase
LTGLKADEELVPASEMKAARARAASAAAALLCNKTEGNEILREGLEYAREKRWLPRSPLPRWGGEK